MIDVRCLPYMPLQIERLRRSKAWLQCKRRPELAFYLMNLWMRSWHGLPAGSLEADDDILADAAMCEPATWTQIKDLVLDGWELREKFYFHPVIEELAAEAAGKLRKNKRRTEQARKSLKVKRFIRYRESDKSVTDTVTETVTDTVTGHEGNIEVEEKDKKESEEEREKNTPSGSSGFFYENGIIRLTQPHFERWEKSFSELNLRAELEGLEPWAAKQGKTWFHALAGALAKRNREAILNREAVKIGITAGQKKPQTGGGFA